jgi:HEAT repeat protein
MRFRKTVFLLSAVGVVFSQLSASPQKERRIYALITVKDYRQACSEGAKLIEDYPDSLSAWQAYMKALSKAGEERTLLKTFQKFRSLFPEDCAGREIIEAISWGIIENGCSSSSPIIRLAATIGAFMGQDVKSIALLKKALQDPNPQIRAAAVKLTSNMRDASLQEEMVRLLSSERHSAVRVEVIKAIGKMKIKSSENQLVAILSSGNSRDEEKAAAIESLVNLMEKANRRDIQRMTHSERAGLRELGSRVVSHTFDCSNLDLIIPLLKDHCSDVRCAAVQTIGLLKVDKCNEKSIVDHLDPLLRDPDPYTAISAAWAMILYESNRGIEMMQRWLVHPNKLYSHFAAGALARTGKYGISWMREPLIENPDPFVKVNIALGLIGQRQETNLASNSIFQFMETSDRIMMAHRGNFNYITKSQVSFNSLIPGQPELVDQTTRLELLNVLAILENPQAHKAVRNFLNKRTWGISGLAAALLLTEGEDQSIEIVEELLSDSNSKIRIQAALILSLWGRGENAIAILQDSYASADREMKERILESIGQIGSDSSIPFLLDALAEPSQILRIIAAASILKCLYH